MAVYVISLSLGALMLVPCCLKRANPAVRSLAAPYSRSRSGLGAAAAPAIRMMASAGGGDAEQKGRYISSVEEAASSLRAGGLVAFPTETVYGLGAHAFDNDAVARIFTVKGRPRSDPLIVHVPTPAAAEVLVRLDTEGLAVMRELAAQFWPGPLTLVAKACPELPPAVTAGTGFVGVRCPNHPRALELLRAANVPVAAPSANRFGHVSPTRAEHVMADLGVSDILVLTPSDAGLSSSSSSSSSSGGEEQQPSVCDVGIESTVLKVDVEAKELVVLRRGGVPEAELARWVASDERAVAAGFSLRVKSPEHKAPPPLEQSGGGAAGESAGGAAEGEGEGEGMVAPGMLLTHYAPDLPSFLLEASASSSGAAASSSSSPHFSVKGAVVLDYGGRLAHLQQDALAYRDLSSTSKASEAATHVFEALRWAEGHAAEGATCVLLASFDGGDEHAPALKDRLYRAASGRSASVAADGARIVVHEKAE